MKNFRDLQVWEKAHLFTLEVYRVTKGFPREELYGLTSQLRRAAASIPANIAEGCGKASGPDFAKFLQIAFGSACECEYHILLAKDLNILGMTEHGGLEANIVEVKRMLASLISKVRSDG
jgi:four helix bundle protein